MVINYIAEPVGDPVLLFIGVALVTVAIVLDAMAYRRKSQGAKVSTQGLWLSIVAGVLMGFFFRFVAAAVSTDFADPVAGLMTPYAAVFVFSLGILLSNFVWNTYFMYRPLKGERVSYGDYFARGTPPAYI